MQYNPLFRSVVRCHLDQPRFLRRDWLADEVSKAVGDPECRFVLIVGEPGSGKSTFIAQSASDDPTAPVYFIRHDQRTPLGDVGARSFLLQIGYQLAAVHPELFNPEQIEIVVRQRVGDPRGVVRRRTRGMFGIDTVGEPISILHDQPFCIGISMVLCLQRSHRRGSIFDSAEFANSIGWFSGPQDTLISPQRSTSDT